MRRLLLPSLLAASLALTSPLPACPQETVSYPPFVLRELKGRLLPPEGDELLPTRVKFVIAEKGKDGAEPREVPVSADGTFFAGLPEGDYIFEIQVEGFLFTLVGEVTISHERGAESMELTASWC